MEDIRGDKIERVLQLYAKLTDGYVIRKEEEALRFGVNKRSIQRDIDDIRNFLDADAERTGIVNSVINDFFPTIYRNDRIKGMKILNERFHIPYSSRFEEGEFRKRIQFMYGGRLQKVTFKYSGLDIDAVLDRLPTAKILAEEDGVYTVQAEVFGKGIEMWLRSQGENVKLINASERNN